MLRKLVVLGLIVLSASLVTVGCGSNGATSDETNGTSAVAPATFVLPVDELCAGPYEAYGYPVTCIAEEKRCTPTDTEWIFAFEVKGTSITGSIAIRSMAYNPATDPVYQVLSESKHGEAVISRIVRYKNLRIDQGVLHPWVEPFMTTLMKNV